MSGKFKILTYVDTLGCISCKLQLDRWKVFMKEVVGMMQDAAKAEMNTKDVPGIVKLASREFHITDDEGEGILQHLIEGKDLTLYGLSNAVTRHSQDVENYDRATQLESIGYNILSMPARQWNRINQAAA